jgi:hypothetical protein
LLLSSLFPFLASGAARGAAVNAKPEIVRLNPLCSRRRLPDLLTGDALAMESLD